MTIKLFEEFSNNKREVSIDEFLDEINIDLEKREYIINWWKKNRAHIKIYHFNFSTRQPMLGACMSENEIAINEKVNMPRHMAHIKLFIALHESRHCDQEAQGILNSLYFQTVVDDNKSEFLRNYFNLEKDANDFAINSMKEIGFEREMRMEEDRLRGNENAGEMIYGMMKRDIERYNPTNFFDLLKKQIF